MQHYLIDQRVDGGGGADAESQREQRGGSEAGATEERSGGEAEIVEEIAEPAREPDVPDFLADMGEAELDGDAAAGLGFGNAGGEEVSDAAIESDIGARGRGRAPGTARRNQLKKGIIGCPPQRSG